MDFARCQLGFVGKAFLHNQESHVRAIIDNFFGVVTYFGQQKPKMSHQL